VVVQTPSPNHDGPRATTLGCVIHSTRGRASNLAAEFRATIDWFASPASQVSAHIVIAADGTIASCVDPALIAWHARWFNETHLGAELVQPNLGDPIADVQLRSLAWWLRQMGLQFGFALTLATLPEHKDIPPGIADGKTDVGSDYSFARLAPFLATPA
jgi:N-acetyl-anhydromuramyl-L-alanine amidase AmpD